MLQTNPSMGEHMPKTIRGFFRKEIRRVTKSHAPSCGNRFVIEGIPVGVPQFLERLIAHVPLLSPEEALIHIPLLGGPGNELLVDEEGSDEGTDEAKKDQDGIDGIANSKGTAQEGDDDHQDDEDRQDEGKVDERCNEHEHKWVHLLIFRHVCFSFPSRLPQ